LDHPAHPALVEVDGDGLEPTGPFDEGPPAAVEQDLRHLRIGEERVEVAGIEHDAHAAHLLAALSPSRSSTAETAAASGAGGRSRRTPASTARAISGRTGIRPTTGSPSTAATSPGSRARPRSSTRTAPHDPSRRGPPTARRSAR